jgi:ABC-type branched-subunit amino acid transport system permease subunit
MTSFMTKLRTFTAAILTIATEEAVRYLVTHWLAHLHWLS